MKVIEDKPDKYGRYPLWFSGASLKDIHEYLFEHYNGFKFAIVFDFTREEYYPLEVPTPVYFADEILEELAVTYDKKIVNNDRIYKEPSS